MGKWLYAIHKKYGCIKKIPEHSAGWMNKHEWVIWETFPDEEKYFLSMINHSQPNERNIVMSWSIAFIGKPKNIVGAMQEEAEKMVGTSKEEYLHALPHLQSLVALNFAEVETEYSPSVIRVVANGHGIFKDGKQVSGQQNVVIESFGGKLV